MSTQQQAIGSEHADAQSTHRVGQIVAVTSTQAIVLLEGDPSGAALRDPPDIGTLLKLGAPQSANVVGLVTAMNAPAPRSEDDLRLLEVEFLGELSRQGSSFTGRFRRGVSIFPVLDDGAFTLAPSDLADLFSPAAAQPDIQLGDIAGFPEMPAMFGIGQLLQGHLAIVGDHGSGKSCAVTLLLRRLAEAAPRVRAVVLDIKGEYGPALGDRAEVIGRGRLRLPLWLLSPAELTQLLLPERTDIAACHISVSRLIGRANALYRARNTTGHPLPDRSGFIAGGWLPLPYETADLLAAIEDDEAHSDADAHLARQLADRIGAISHDPGFSFLFAPGGSETEILGQIFQIPQQSKPITVLDLAGLPSEAMHIVVAVITRLALRLARLSGGQVPAIVVCEEAERFAPGDPVAHPPSARQSLLQLACDGEALGLSLIMVSAEASKIEPAVLSRCKSLMAMRLSRERDQSSVRSMVSGLSPGWAGLLAVAADGEAILFGAAFPVPTRIRLDPLPPENCPAKPISALLAGGEGEAFRLDVPSNEPYPPHKPAKAEDVSTAVLPDRPSPMMHERRQSGQMERNTVIRFAAEEISSREGTRDGYAATSTTERFASAVRPRTGAGSIDWRSLRNRIIGISGER
ncbi:ATP-binding protein [Rhodoligotrophos ferricapiens]|uniref:ATP-binding protein n=1 Tax=Rhodoligotrophos ferricapiens TaxID=3069264 RepID=UPI00315CFBF0